MFPFIQLYAVSDSFISTTLDPTILKGWPILWFYLSPLWGFLSVLIPKIYETLKDDNALNQIVKSIRGRDPALWYERTCPLTRPLLFRGIQIQIYASLYNFFMAWWLMSDVKIKYNTYCHLPSSWLCLLAVTITTTVAETRTRQGKSEEEETKIQL